MTASSGAQDAFRAGLRALAHERIEVAVEQLGLAAAEAPDDATVHAFLASALFADARSDASGDAIAQALRLAPDGYWPNLKAGELRVRLGDPVTAVEHFLVALRSAEPGSADAAAAQLALIRARREVAGAISHRAVLPRFSWWVARRRSATARAGER